MIVGTRYTDETRLRIGEGNCTEIIKQGNLLNYVVFTQVIQLCFLYVICTELRLYE
jgi:hypothetical protein